MSRQRHRASSRTLYETRYSETFGVVDYKSESKIYKFKMVDLIWRNKIKKVDWFRWNSVLMDIWNRYSWCCTQNSEFFFVRRKKFWKNKNSKNFFFFILKCFKKIELVACYVLLLIPKSVKSEKNAWNMKSKIVF